jgi:hypothetical protein
MHTCASWVGSCLLLKRQFGGGHQEWLTPEELYSSTNITEHQICIFHVNFFFLGAGIARQMLYL